jgi:hypothetical protein
MQLFFPFPDRNYYNNFKLILLFLQTNTLICTRRTIVVLCGESCSSRQELGSDSCIQIYQRMHCIIYI